MPVNFFLRLLVCLFGFFVIPVYVSAEETSNGHNVKTENSRGVPVEITAERIEFDQEREEYHAIGGVDVAQGPIRLIADTVTFQKLTGRLFAAGHVHLRDG